MECELSYMYLFKCINKVICTCMEILLFIHVYNLTYILSSVGSHTYIGMSVQGTGQNVNKVDSNPIDEPDDNDKNRFYIGDANAKPTWLGIDAGRTIMDIYLSCYVLMSLTTMYQRYF